MSVQLLLISNSTNPGEAYLGWPRLHISTFLKNKPVKRILFIPFAGVNISSEGVNPSYVLYTQKVKAVFSELGYTVYSIVDEYDPIKAVKEAECIMIGGGNTYFLVAMLYRWKIMEPIREKLLQGTPYIGWSAGSNIACPSLRTTNDMPIIEPESFNTLDVIPFQINPHYLDANPQGHGGETREQRIMEFLAVNPLMKVAGLREATALVVENNHLELVGTRPLRYFEYRKEPIEFQPGDDLSLLMEKLHPSEIE
jgi:dipeptidase E